MSQLIITSIDAIEVTVPIEAPLRHSYGVHEAFTRTLVTVRTADGLVGLGETSASAADVKRLGSVVIGMNALELGRIRMRVSERFYWSRNTLVVAALEMACLDLQGKAFDVPAHRLLGGALREDIGLAAYCFYRYPGPDAPAVDDPESMAEHAADLVARHGFGTVKLKAGVLEPDVEMRTLRAIRERLPRIRLRIDPNAAWTTTTAISWLRELEAVGLEYLEDPAAGRPGMAEVRSRTTLPLATNMCVVDFEDLPAAIDGRSVDVILSDPWYWGGPTRVHVLSEMCRVFGLGMGMHSGIELGVGMAVMAHTGVTLRGLTMDVDAHYHHLVDDVIVGPRLLPTDGRLRPPDGPGWGVELDDDKVARYHELHRSGGYANIYVDGDSGMGPDPHRPAWVPIMPAW